MKKVLSKSLVWLVAIAMMLTQLAVPAMAVGANEIKECVCDPATRTGEFVDHVDPTCAEYGYDVYDCDTCDGYYVILTDVPTGNHDIVNYDYKAPTCTEIGWEAYEACNTCDYTTYVEIQATGHNYIPVVTDPTCTEEGYTTYTCDACGDSYMDDPVDALGHAPGDIVVENNVDPECEVPGSYDNVVYCDVCGVELSRESVDVDALTHDWVEIDRVEAGCVVDGKIVYECSLCGETKEETITCVGKHDYDTFLLDDATCETAQELKYVCKACGYTFNEPVVEPLSHDPSVKLEAVAPTCTETGLTEGWACSRCDMIIVPQEIVPANGHSYEAVVTAPTCTAEGYTTYTCSVCGDSYVDDIVAINPLSHHGVITKEAVEATCVAPGLTREVVCGDCGLLIASQKVIEINPDNHDLKADVTDADCENDGYTTHTCQREGCGYSYVDSIVPAHGHTAAAPVEENRTEADCENDGSYDVVVYCSICDVELSRVTEVIAAHGHTAADGKVENRVEPTCTENGSYDIVEYCSICDAELSRQPMSIPALRHNLTAHDAKDATCTEIGWNAYATCSRCDYTTYVEIPALGHSYDAVVTDPTCTEAGYTTYTCSRCDDEYVGDEVLALNHDDRESLGDVLPTCLEKGYTVFKCLRCEVVFRDAWVDALGHSLEYVDAQDATCLNIGWDAYEYCTVCDHTTYVEIEALGHDLFDVEGLDATCTENGYSAHQECNRCDYTTARTSLALGHDLFEVDAQDATCLSIGWNAYEFCSRCDYTTYEEIAALGHNITEFEAKAPTCTEDGHPAYESCDRCDYNTEKVIPALGHNAVVDDAVAPTYDETGLTEGSHCDACGEILVPQEIVDCLQEEITFSYDATGINGSDKATNSGYVYVNVYMNVNSDIARLYGVDFALNFNENLTLVAVDGCIFDVNDSTYLDAANAAHQVTLAQNMGMSYAGDKVFEKGEYLFATLTFKVANDFYYQDASIEFVEGTGTAARDSEWANELVVDFGTGAVINVTMLGDSNGDGKINSEDTLAFAKFFGENLGGDYETTFDMNKDGHISGDDFVLLRGAVVGNNDYLN